MCRKARVEFVAHFLTPYGDVGIAGPCAAVHASSRAIYALAVIKWIKMIWMRCLRFYCCSMRKRSSSENNEPDDYSCLSMQVAM